MPAEDEVPLGQVRVRASAQAWPERTWAVEGAGGLGHLLAQELVAAGERVLDVQPKLAAGAVNKNDPNDDPARPGRVRRRPRPS